MNINSAFPSKYLAAAELEGRDTTLTIRGVKTESIGQNKDVKPVVYFDETEKGLVLNKTNANTIAQVCGSPLTENWSGLPITLYPAEIEFQGKMVESIRVRLRTQRPQQQPAVTQARGQGMRPQFVDDDQPF